MSGIIRIKQKAYLDVLVGLHEHYFFVFKCILHLSQFINRYLNFSQIK